MTTEEHSKTEPLPRAVNGPYTGCLIPITQSSPCRARWTADLLEGEELTLVDPGEESWLFDGYALVLLRYEQLPKPWWEDGLPGSNSRLYINGAVGGRAQTRAKVRLISRRDMAEWKRSDPQSAEILRAIYRLTSVVLPIRQFDYWKQLVADCFVPEFIREHQCWKTASSRRGSLYCSGGGYVGENWFDTSWYGRPDWEEGIRQAGAYVRERSGGRLNENRVRQFLAGIGPLDCGPYICGVKATDRSTFNNGGSGGGVQYRFFYDKEALYRGMCG